jgi:hypothetical protein
MLANDRVIFPERELLCLGPRVLFRRVIETRISGADELDLDG